MDYIIVTNQETLLTIKSGDTEYTIAYPNE